MNVPHYSEGSVKAQRNWPDTPISVWSQKQKRMPSIIPADQFVQKYTVRTAKSVQTHAHSKHMATTISSAVATASLIKCCHSEVSHYSSGKRTSSDVRPTTCGIFGIYWHKRCKWPYSSLETSEHRDTNKYPLSLYSSLLHTQQTRNHDVAS